MVKISEDLPPFLSKLVNLTRSTDPAIARWNDKGGVYIVIDEEGFKKTLKKYFKGTKQTFIRQLHFYGFKKIESNVGTWGFTQEKGLFVRDNLALVKNIKRKKKIDPDSQRIASYAEVQSLKNQLHFCQEVIDELKGEISLLRNRSSSKKSEFKASVPVQTKKRMRSSDSEFEDLCSKITFSNNSESYLTKLPSISDAMEVQSDVENLSDIFVDLELEPLDSQLLKRQPSYQDLIINEHTSFSEAVEVVSEATKVSPSDVSKIISFLTKLSLTEEPSVDSKSLGLGAMDSLLGPRVQKVGAS